MFATASTWKLVNPKSAKSLNRAETVIETFTSDSNGKNHEWYIVTETDGHTVCYEKSSGKVVKTKEQLETVPDATFQALTDFAAFSNIRYLQDLYNELTKSGKGYNYINLNLTVKRLVASVFMQFLSDHPAKFNKTRVFDTEFTSTWKETKTVQLLPKQPNRGSAVFSDLLRTKHALLVTKILDSYAKECPMFVLTEENILYVWHRDLGVARNVTSTPADFKGTADKLFTAAGFPDVLAVFPFTCGLHPGTILNRRFFNTGNARAITGGASPHLFFASVGGLDITEHFKVACALFAIHFFNDSKKTVINPSESRSPLLGSTWSLVGESSKDRTKELTQALLQSVKGATPDELGEKYTWEAVQADIQAFATEWNDLAESLQSSLSDPTEVQSAGGIAALLRDIVMNVVPQSDGSLTVAIEKNVVRTEDLKGKKKKESSREAATEITADIISAAPPPPARKPAEKTAAKTAEKPAAKPKGSGNPSAPAPEALTTGDPEEEDEEEAEENEDEQPVPTVVATPPTVYKSNDENILYFPFSALYLNTDAGLSDNVLLPEQDFREITRIVAEFKKQKEKFKKLADQVKHSVRKPKRGETERAYVRDVLLLDENKENQVEYFAKAMVEFYPSIFNDENF